MFLLILFFLLSIIFSFLCSIWEAVLLSIPPSHVEVRLKEGGAVGKKLKSFKGNIDRPLSAILTLNTIAHTVGAIGVGAQAEKIWSAGSSVNIPLLNIGISASFIVATLMTIAILVLSEIIPKTLGATYWRKLTPFTVISLNIISYPLYPFIVLSQFITKMLKKREGLSVFSRADFSAMAEIGEKEGIFEQGESKIIQNLLRFNTIQAKDIMTPRTVVKMANQNTPIKDFYADNKTLRFSRIPIFKDSKDHINGFVLKDEVLSSIINEDGNSPLIDIIRDIMIVNEQYPLPDLFNKLMEKREHIALVVDEFGGMAGIVTMEDVIETLLGMEIVDELDNAVDMQMLARKNWEMRARNLGIIDSTEEDEKETTKTGGSQPENTPPTKSENNSKE